MDIHLKEWRAEVRKNTKSSKRKVYKAWQSKNNKLFDLLKPTSNPENFDEDEKQFYLDQKAVSRKMALSGQIDEDYDNLQREQMEVKEDNDNDDAGSTSGSSSVMNSHENDTLLLTQSNLRSGKVRMTKSLVDASIQTDVIPQATTPIRQKRNFVSDVKTAIASTSSKAGITSEQARRAFQSVCQVFTKDTYYLSVEEVPTTTL